MLGCEEGEDEVRLGECGMLSESLGRFKSDS